MNNQVEEFDLYFMQQLKETKNFSYYEEEPKEEELLEENDNNIEFKDEQEIVKKAKIKRENSKCSFPKRYQTYSLAYKKEILAEVN